MKCELESFMVKKQLLRFEWEVLQLARFIELENRFVRTRRSNLVWSCVTLYAPYELESPIWCEAVKSKFSIKSVLAVGPHLVLSYPHSSMLHALVSSGLVAEPVPDKGCKYLGVKARQ